MTTKSTLVLSTCSMANATWSLTISRMRLLLLYLMKRRLSRSLMPQRSPWVWTWKTLMLFKSKSGQRDALSWLNSENHLLTTWEIEWQLLHQTCKLWSVKSSELSWLPTLKVLCNFQSTPRLRFRFLVPKRPFSELLRQKERPPSMVWFSTVHLSEELA